MKLAEALKLRSDTQKYIVQLRSRLQRAAVTTEGDEPAERIDDLILDLHQQVDLYRDLVARINRTNTQIEIEPGTTMTDALALRDALMMKLPILDFLMAHTSNALNQHRQQRSELRAISHVDIADVQSMVNGIGAELRRLDNLIQERNWQTELL